MWQKSNKTDYLFTKVFIFFKHQCYPLQNSSLGQLHTDVDVVTTFGSSAGSIQPVWSSVCPLHSYQCFESPKMTSFGHIFTFKKKKRVTGAGIWWIGGLGNHSNAFWGQKSCDGGGSVTWGFVMMEHPFVFNVISQANDPFFWAFQGRLYKKHPKECNGHTEDHTGWRLPALLPEVGTTSPSVCNCPRKLFWRG